MSSLRIAAMDPHCAEALALLRLAAIEARALYPESAGLPWPTNAPLEPRGAYVLAFSGDDAVGCGALRPIDATTVEVRRMYVVRSARGSGVGRAMVRHLTTLAARLDYRVMRVETGYRQTPAIALYESCGFVRIPPFGAYADDPTSVCFEKTFDD